MKKAKKRTENIPVKVDTSAKILEISEPQVKKITPKLELAFSRKDFAMVQEVQKILTRVEIKLDGATEIMAASQVMFWLPEFEKRMATKLEEIGKWEKERREYALKLLDEKENA